MNESSIQDLEARKAELVAQRDVQALENEVAVLESEGRIGSVMEASQILANRLEPWSDQPGFNAPGLASGFSFHIAQPQDFREGDYQPFFMTDVQLAEVTGVGRIIAQMDAVGIGALSNLVNYTLGTGYEYTLQTKRGHETEVHESLVSAMNFDMETFDEENHWRQTERELMEACVKEGGYFARLSKRGSMVRLRIVDPVSVRTPINPHDVDNQIGQPALCWKYGIGTDLGDTEVVHGYYIDWTGDHSDWELVLPEYMEHCKVNTPRRVKRGMSDFYATYQWLDLASKVLRNTGEGSSVQAAIAYIRQHAPGTSAAAASSLSSGRDEFSVQRQTPSGNCRTVNYQKMQPGTVLDIDAGKQYLSGPLGSQRNPQFIQVTEAIQRMAGTRWNMPEFMISGDASNANYSSTLVAESPFVKATENRQEFHRESFVSLRWKVLYIRADSGAYVKYGIESAAELRQLRRHVQMKVDMPPVQVRNKEQEATINETLHRNGILSLKTWSERAELDIDEEKSRGAEKQAPPPSPFGPGAGGGMPPSAGGNSGSPEPVAPGAAPTATEPAAPIGQTGTNLPARESTIREAVRTALESTESTEEAIAILSSLDSDPHLCGLLEEEDQ